MANYFVVKSETKAYPMYAGQAVSKSTIKQTIKGYIRNGYTLVKSDVPLVITFEKVKQDGLVHTIELVLQEKEDDGRNISVTALDNLPVDRTENSA